MTDVLKGTTNYSTVVRIIDSGDGTPETGVTSTTAGLNFTFHRDLAAGVLLSSTTAVALSTLSSSTTAHTDGGFLHLTDGYCRLDLQDAAYASGSDKVVLTGTATGMTVIGRDIPLVSYNPNDAVRLGLTSLPNAAADAAGGMIISDAGGVPGDDIALTTDLSSDADIADAVADEQLSGHVSAGSWAKAVADIETAAAAIQVVTDKFVFTVANQVDANMLSISGSSTAADNAEAQFDGTTGLVGDLFPSTQAQIGGIANVGSAVHRPVASYTLTTGTQSANTFAETVALDGTRHEHTDDAGVLLLEYHFLIGGGTASAVQITGYVTGSNDDVDIFGYDWVAAAYVQIGNISGSSSTANSVYSFDLFVDMVGSGTDSGKVDIKIAKASGLSSATLAIDQIFVAFSQGVEGYSASAIWYDDTAGNTNVVVGIDGTAGNPVSSEAAVETLLTSTGYRALEVAPGSEYTMATTHNSRLIKGHGGILALGGQDVDDSHFFEMAVSGVGTAATEMEFHDCEFGTTSVQKVHCYDCGFGATVTMTLAGDYNFIRCNSLVAGEGTPTFTKTAGQAITGQWRYWAGSLTLSGIESGDVFTISGSQLGNIILNGADGTAKIVGIYESITDNRTGSPTLTIVGAIKGDDVAAILVDTGEIGTAGAGLTDLGGMSTAMKAEVNVEALDVINTDTFAEPTSPPAATASVVNKLGWITALARNKKTGTATEKTLLADGGSTTAIATSTVSDDGVTYTETEWS